MRDAEEGGENKMIRDEDKLQILLEEMRSNFKLAFEAISGLECRLAGRIDSLDAKIDGIDKKYDLTTRILSDQIKELGIKIDKIGQKLEGHMRQPSHA